MRFLSLMERSFLLFTELMIVKCFLSCALLMNQETPTLLLPNEKLSFIIIFKGTVNFLWLL